MTDLEARLDRELERLALEPGGALVAVSGGPDSLALLDLLHGASAVAGRIQGLVHVDHGIHPNSSAVAASVVAIGRRYGLPASVERLALGPAASETAARRARYAAFRRALIATGTRFVFLGHTGDDQVETLVMRFLRGSGPAGLAGMVPQRGPWVRPLLGFGRAELAEYLAARGIEPWTDPANADPVHLRSWVRHRLLPIIEERFPRVRAEILASQVDFREQRLAWDCLLEGAELDLKVEDGGYSVAAATLQGYSSPVVRTLLRAFGRRCDLALGRAEIDRLQMLLAVGASGHRVDLSSGATVELSVGRLRLYGRLEHPIPEPVTLSGESGEVRFGPWQVAWAPALAPADPLPRSGFRTWIAAGAAQIAVRPWHHGDRIRPIRGTGSRLVVRSMQDARVPRSRRPHWPVFETAGVVWWVPGVCRSDSLVPEPGVLATRIDVGPS